MEYIPTAILYRGGAGYGAGCGTGCGAGCGAGTADAGVGGAGGAGGVCMIYLFR